MSEIGQLYTLAIWHVNKENETDFLEAWQQFAFWTEKNQQSAGLGQLLQDIDQPERFISFGTWEKESDITKWRSKPEFGAFFNNAREMCEEIEPGTLRVISTSRNK